MAANGRPLLDDELVLRADGGMLTEQPLPTIYRGRTIQFLFADGVAAGREIFTCFDGALCGPVPNGSRLNTPVAQWERLASRPHTAMALVVDRRPVPAEELAVPLNLPVAFGDGQAGLLQVDCRLQALLQCRETRPMAEEYLRGAFHRPEEAANRALRTAAQELLPTLKDQLRGLNPMDAVGRADSTLAVGLARRIARRAEELLPWLGVCYPALTLTVTNGDIILRQANRGYELSVEMRQKLVEALLAVYTSDTFPAPIAGVLSGYVQANPGVSEGELVQLCTKLKALSQRNSPQQIFTTAVNLGLIPPPRP